MVRSANELEYGVAFMIKRTEQKANSSVAIKKEKGVPASLSWMKNLYDLCEAKENVTIEVEL